MYPSSSLSGISRISAQQINEAIWKVNPGGPAVGASYVLWARTYGIDAEIAAAQGCIETGYFAKVYGNNPAGLRGSKGFFKYASLREGIESQIKNLKKYATADNSNWFYTEQVRRSGEGGTIRGMASLWVDPSDPHGGDSYAQNICTIVDRFNEQEAPAHKGVDGHWAEHHVEAASTVGVMRGQPDGQLRPDWPITRAELSTVLSRCLDYPAIAQELSMPSDVPTTHWAFEYVLESLRNDWMKCRSDGLFYPDVAATREDVAQALVNSDAPRPANRISQGFPDVSGITAAVVEEAYKSGFLSGYPDGLMRPKDPVTRAEIAAMLDRSFGWSEQGHIGSTSGSLQDAVWIEKLKIWVPSFLGRLTYDDGQLMGAPIQLENQSLIQTIGLSSIIKSPTIIIGAGLIGASAYLMLRKQ